MSTLFRTKKARQRSEKETEKWKNFPKYSESPEVGIKLHCLKLQGFLSAKFHDSLKRIPFCCVFVSAGLMRALGGLAGKH